MTHVDVEIEEVRYLLYTWTCPECGDRQSLSVFNDDRAVQTIICKICGQKLTRQAPGDYAA